MDHDIAAAFDRDLSEVFGVSANHEEIAEHFERNTYRGRAYFHLTKERHGIERGTAIVDNTVIRGFPSIPRILVLDPGISEFFDGSVAIEEKLNGYNVRIARAGGEVFGFTRSGYICPFTTALAREDPFASFLDEYPDYTVCGELIGPKNPYTAHEYEGIDEAELRVFDLRANTSGEPMPVQERQEICDRHGLPATPAFGVHEPSEAIEETERVIADLDERGREGVVLKSLDGTRQVKYTTSAIHRNDLAHAFGQPFDYGREFLFSRVIREAFQAVELDGSETETRERAQALGEAILLPAVEAIETVERGDKPGDRHVVRGEPIVIESLLAQFYSFSLELEIHEDYYEDGERVVEFTKVADASRNKIEHFLSGGTIDQ